jgi:hypothetical protein
MLPISVVAESLEEDSAGKLKMSLFYVPRTQSPLPETRPGPEQRIAGTAAQLNITADSPKIIRLFRRYSSQ